MFRIPEFDIKVDFEKSSGSYLFDQNRGEYFLDFFSFWSTLSLGYNHPIFDESFTDTIKKLCRVKMANNTMNTEEWEQFTDRFAKGPGRDFSHFHFTCTGALAVESALKSAIDYRRSLGLCRQPVVISFKGNFHGVSCWGLATDRFPPHDKRLEGYPQIDSWPKLKDDAEVEEFIRIHGADDIAAILVEPVQCTFGDRYFSRNFFTRLRHLCDWKNIPLIFDEIQIGFGVSGKMWYYQHLNIEPDIVVFGKKSQVSGMMAKEHLGAAIQSPVKKLELTWDGDLIDMVRCYYIMEAYERYNILDNVNERSDQLAHELAPLPSELRNFRHQGLLVAFDLPSEDLKKRFAQLCFGNHLLVSPASYNCIRLRPNLNVSAEEIHEGALRIKKSVEQL
jgi:L-lysine 6-transaminase